MLDIKFVRENPDVVKQNIRNKFQDSKLPLVDEVIELDKENREIKQEVEALKGGSGIRSPKRSASSWARERKKKPRRSRTKWRPPAAVSMN